MALWPAPQPEVEDPLALDVAEQLEGVLPRHVGPVGDDVGGEVVATGAGDGEASGASPQSARRREAALVRVVTREPPARGARSRRAPGLDAGRRPAARPAAPTCGRFQELDHRRRPHRLRRPGRAAGRRARRRARVGARQARAPRRSGERAGGARRGGRARGGGAGGGGRAARAGVRGRGGGRRAVDGRHDAPRACGRRWPASSSARRSAPAHHASRPVGAGRRPEPRAGRRRTRRRRARLRPARRPAHPLGAPRPHAPARPHPHPRRDRHDERRRPSSR